MKYLLFPLLLLPLLLQGQTELGNDPGKSSFFEGIRNTRSTRAVIIGISDYQDPGITDLRFAHKDAEAFANYLRSPAGGSLNEDQLRLLLNSEATQAQLGNALDWLMEVTQEGDRAIIYFSGHGDLEKKTRSQQGFLLCWDAPPRVYMGGGAFDLRSLQDVISTLSLTNKANVVVITDACHAGTLAGHSIGGTQATAENLRTQYANEIKILSCQPGEYSVEGTQWGGGRGAFSYHLMDGLYGLADNNEDRSVNLQELGRYLEDHVARDVDPISQIPLVRGNLKEQLAKVNSQILAELRAGKTNQLDLLSAAGTKGIEDEVLATVDSTTREVYHLFKESLKEKIFLSPANACAEAYYARLILEPKMERLYSTMRRNYAAALQDDAQQVMNRWLKTDVRELVLTKNSQLEKYMLYPGYLERAIELLGPKHYMIPSLQARKVFFEGHLLYLSRQGNAADSTLGEQALKKFREALTWQPDLPQVYYLMSKVFWVHMMQPDSSEYYGTIAASLAPTWVLPLTDMARMYAYQYKKFDRARPFLERATILDSNALVVLQSWGDFYFYQKQFRNAESYYNKCLQINPAFIWALNNLGVVYLEEKRFEEAETLYRRILEVDPGFMPAYYNIACILGPQNQVTEAFGFLEQAIKTGLNDYDYLQQDTDLIMLREDSIQWHALMKKYFPDKVKD